MPATSYNARHLLAAISILAGSATALSQSDKLSTLSLEELGEVPVVISEKLPERLFDTAVGSFVFDTDAIENLPVDSIPEMLRYAPGMHIMRSSNGIWGTGIRGMNSRFMNRVLFTVDEQNIHGRTYSGLFGNEHDLLIDDIASVEVVYGPGGSLWGSNAVNGMVNVIMKSAFETEGSIIRIQGGSENRSLQARTGWKINEQASARIYAKVSHREPSHSIGFKDDWTTGRFGFQIDKKLSAENLLSLAGDAYSSKLGYAVNLPDFNTGDVALLNQRENQRGLNLQAKWTKQASNNTLVTLRGWSNYSVLDTVYANAEIASGGIEVRLRRQLSKRDRISLRGGLSFKHEALEDTKIISYKSDYRPASGHSFLGLEYSHWLAPEKLELSIGASSVYDSYLNNNDILPTASLIYHQTDNDRIWLSYGKAKRPVTSSMGNVESAILSVFLTEPRQITTARGNISVDRQFNTGLQGNSLKNEEHDAFEAGYRHIFSENKSLNLSAFYSRYDQIFGGALLSKGLQIRDKPYFTTQTLIGNQAFGNSHGFEASLKWDFKSGFKTIANYAYIHNSFNPIYLATDPASMLTARESTDVLENNVPNHLASIWISKELSPKLRADLGLRYSSSFENPYGSQDEIFQSDLRISWQMNERSKLSMVGRNLLNALTNEGLLKDRLGHSTEIQREFYFDFQTTF